MYFLHPENVRALPNEGVLPNVSSGVHREQQRQTTVSRTKDSKWQSPEDDANVVGLNAGKTEMRKKHKSFFKLLLWQQVTAMAMCAQGMPVHPAAENTGTRAKAGHGQGAVDGFLVSIQRD